ncbi:MAG: DALR anticodon-binding domain-containing protein [Collinsella sp.]
MARDERFCRYRRRRLRGAHHRSVFFFARCAASTRLARTIRDLRQPGYRLCPRRAILQARAGCGVRPQPDGRGRAALADASEAAQTAVDAALAAEDYPAAFAALAALRAPIDRFFDEVMVMDKDEQLRDNRLKLLNRFEAVFSGIANIGELARKK